MWQENEAPFSISSGMCNSSIFLFFSFIHRSYHSAPIRSRVSVKEKRVIGIFIWCMLPRLRYRYTHTLLYKPMFLYPHYNTYILISFVLYYSLSLKSSCGMQHFIMTGYKACSLAVAAIKLLLVLCSLLLALWNTFIWTTCWSFLICLAHSCPTAEGKHLSSWWCMCVYRRIEYLPFLTCSPEILWVTTFTK